MLLAAALLLAQAAEFPLFEKDPWAGVKPDSTVTRVMTENGKRAEVVLTVKSSALGQTVVQVAADGGDPKEETLKFVSFSDTLTTEEGGYKQTGKSTKTATVAGRRLKTLIREFGPVRLAFERWRVHTADEPPGGLVQVDLEGEGTEVKQKFTYACKGIEKLKVDGKDVECWRFDLTGTETAKKKRKLEGSYWLSAQVPGLLVKSHFKDVEDKTVVAETTVEVAKFERK